MVPELQDLAPVFVERLLNTAAEGVVFAGFIRLLLCVIRRQNSRTRFVIWFCTLLAIVALPFLAGSSFMAPHLRALPPAYARGQIMISSSWAFFLFVAWAVGSGFFLLRLSIGLWHVRRYRRNCSDLDPVSLHPEIARILRDFGSRRRVNLSLSNTAAVPAAIGFFQPAIVFPAWLLPRLSTEEIKLILLHELAHLRRWDDWTNVAQKIVKAVLFFHPAVWWIEHRLTLEREMACDDMVLAQAASPRAYASSLISFAEKLQGGRALALAQTLVGRMRQMSPRLVQILDEKQPRSTRLSRPVLGLSASVLAIVLGAVPYTPQIVAFRPQPALSPARQVQMAQGTLNAADQSAKGAMTRSIEVPVALHPRFAARRRTISAAAFRPPPTMIPLHLKAAPQRPLAAMQAKASQHDFSVQETIVILRTTQYDPSGPGIWTLCVWRIGGNNVDGRRWESDIFVSSI